MVSLPKVVGLVFSGLLLSMGVSTVGQTEIFAPRQGGQGVGETPLHQMERGQPSVGKTIQGEVLRIEDENCVIKGQDDKEVRLQIDGPLLKAAGVEPGERIEAKVNEQNHVLSFRTGGQGSQQ